MFLVRKYKKRIYHFEILKCNISSVHFSAHMLVQNLQAIPGNPPVTVHAAELSLSTLLRNLVSTPFKT